MLPLLNHCTKVNITIAKLYEHICGKFLSKAHGLILYVYKRDTESRCCTNQAIWFGFLLFASFNFVCQYLRILHQRVSFPSNIRMISLIWLWNNIYILAETDQMRNNLTTFGKEKKVASLLDESLGYIPIESGFLHLNISRLPKTNWKLTCNTTEFSFNCMVYAENLSMVIIRVHEFAFTNIGHWDNFNLRPNTTKFMHDSKATKRIKHQQKSHETIYL